MSITYTKSTNFTAKDSMATTNPDKLLSGVPFDFEFDAISASFGLAAPSLSPTFTGTVTADTISANSITGTAASDWNTAYGWGDHAAVGYVETEADPVFTASPAHGIADGDIANWDAAHGWGDHGVAGYLTAETDPVFVASEAYAITATDKANWTSAYNDSVTNMAFNSTDGVLTLTQQDGGTRVVDLDGRYATIAGIDTYTAGGGLVAAGNEFSHADTSSQASVTNTGQTFIQSVTLDEFGHLSGVTSGTAVNTDTQYTAGAALSLSGTTFSHGDTSSVADSLNAGNVFIQDLIFDTYGHVTGVVTGTASDTNTDTTYSAGAGLTLSGTTFAHQDTSSQASITATGQDFIKSIIVDTNGHITGMSTGTATDTNTTYTGGTNISLSGTTFNLNSSLTGLTDVTTSTVSIGNYEMELSGSDLVIKHSNNKIFKLSSTGDLTVTGDIIAYGTP